MHPIITSLLIFGLLMTLGFTYVACRRINRHLKNNRTQFGFLSYIGAVFLGIVFYATYSFFVVVFLER